MDSTQSDIDLKAVGKRIMLQRESCGMTQEVLAEYTGLSVKHISVIENGFKAMRMGTMVKICTALQLDYTYLITGKKVTADMLDIQNLWLKLKPHQRDVMLQLLKAFQLDNSIQE